jgi:hypothetical protein
VELAETMVVARSSLATIRIWPKKSRPHADLTDKPFGVNLTILPTIEPVPYDEYREGHHRKRRQSR